MADRSTFGPVVAVGVVSSALAALAGSKTWATESRSLGDPLGTLQSAGQQPLGLALGLVVLATWGVLLVTRGVVRRWVAVLGALASLGLVVVVVHAGYTVPDRVVDAARESGLGRTPDVGLTAWFWVGGVAALVSLAAAVLAVRDAPGWPSMGSRYDAPGARQERPRAAAIEEIDLWKSMDEGHDPTR